MWMCVQEPLVCGRFDKRAAGQRWQVKPARYSVTSLSERVTARQPGHLKIKGAISLTLNFPSFSFDHPGFSFISCYSPPLFPNPFHFFQTPPSLFKSFSAYFIHFCFQILAIAPSLFCNFILPFMDTLAAF